MRGREVEGRRGGGKIEVGDRREGKRRERLFKQKSIIETILS